MVLEFLGDKTPKGTDLLIKAMIQVFKENPDCGATVVIVGETTSKVRIVFGITQESNSIRGFRSKIYISGQARV